MIFEHKSVLLMETVDSLNVKPDGIYVDGTLGGGGHAYEVSRRLGEKGRLIGIDQDADAIAAATERPPLIAYNKHFAKFARAPKNCICLPIFIGETQQAIP